MPDRLILGIESSCDETAAAVVAEGRAVLSNVVASQLVHADYGGVVPELASREHLRAIVPVVREAMRAAGLTADAAGYRRLSAVAVTEGPGLAGALLVGITFAKGLAFGAELPLIAINHLEGHIQAVLLEAEARFAEASPLLAAVVSGGHTHLYLASQDGASQDGASRDGAGLWSYRNVGRTVDDAAGEAYDKVAKLLGLPYPGGPWMDALAAHGDPTAVPFGFTKIKDRGNGRAAPEPHAPPGEPRFDFSFSGIKTAVRRYVDLHGMRDAVAGREAAMRLDGLLTAKASDPKALAQALHLLDKQTLDLIASFQSAVVGNLVRTTLKAAEHFGARAVLVSGGVSANRLLRERMSSQADRHGIPVAFPSLSLSTDNAAMIAAAAWPKLLNGRFADGTLEAAPGLRLG